MLIQDILELKGGAGVIGIGRNDAVVAAVDKMVGHDIGSLVVLDRDRMIGLLTFREVLRALHETSGNLGALTVGAIMIGEPIIGGLNDRVDYVRKIMTEQHIRYLPVMEGDELRGIISFHDVARASLKKVSYENQLLKRYIKNWPESE